MSSGPRTILFLNHSASRNGASILLLHLLQWLRANSDFRLEVLSAGRGPLLDEFRAVATTHVWRNPLSIVGAFRLPWLDARLGRLEHALLRAWLARRHYDLVYANTAATWNQLAALRGRSGAVLWHIHELSYALDLLLRDRRADGLLLAAARLVAVSQPVVDSLTGRYAVPHDRVDMVHGFVPDHQLPVQRRLQIRQDILQQLGWPGDCFVVGACGALGWRKGSDLYLQIARRLKAGADGDKYRFLWVGGSERTDTETLQFDHDRRALGLDGVCRRVPSTAIVDDYYCVMDMLALTSREDPFPLVMLEAAMHARATVCFAGAGGAPDFVADDAGVAVPYLDLDGFSQVVAALRSDPARIDALGRAAQHKARSNHCVETQGPKLLRSIEHCLAAGAGKLRTT